MQKKEAWRKNSLRMKLLAQGPRLQARASTAEESGDMVF